MRPKSIVTFELLFVATLILGSLQVWFGWEYLQQVGSIGFFLIVQIITFSMLGGLVLLVSRKRSKIAMWIIITFTVAGLPMIYASISSSQIIGSIWIALLQTACQITGIVLLFFPSSRKWMATKNEDRNLAETFS